MKREKMSPSTNLDILKDMVISEENILIGLQADSDRDVIIAMGDLLVEGGFVKNTFIRAVLDREIEFPTGLKVTGGGVAIPHADSEHVNNSTLGVATLADPVEFRAMAEPEKIISVSLVMMLAVADKKKVVPVLTKVISILKNENAIKALQSATSKNHVKQIILEHIKSQK